MEIGIQDTPRGYALGITGPYWKTETCEIVFPEEIWQNFPPADRQALKNELAYILTLAPPIILRHPTVWYPTPRPRFLDIYEECFTQAIPNMVEPIPGEDADDILKVQLSVLRHFPTEASSMGMERSGSWNPRRVILPFTFGKDSLLSLATLTALGYEVILVNIDECVLPKGKAIRKELEEEFLQEHDHPCHCVRNEIQLLSDWQVLNTPVTRLHQVHIHFVYLLAMIPFCTYYRAPFIVLSNEFENSLPHVHKGGFIAPHIYMQGREAAGTLARIVQGFSNGQITAINLIGILDNFSIHRILHEEFPAYGRYRVTCHMEMSDYSRWCHSCYRCAQPFMYFSALGNSPFSHGFEASMLEMEKKPLFSLFREDTHPGDEYHRFVAQEEALAFAMAHRRGVRGDLMELFEEKYLPRMENKRKSLAGKVFRLQAKPGRTPVEKRAADLYRRILKTYL